MIKYALGGFILFSTIFSSAAFSQNIPERVCKPAVIGSGAALVQHVAKRDSVLNWQEKVKKLYGDNWADYSSAKVKRFPCSRDGWFARACVVKAQPCKEVEG